METGSSPTGAYRLDAMDPLGQPVKFSLTPTQVQAWLKQNGYTNTQRVGTATLVGGTKAVAETSVTAASIILVSVQALGTVAVAKAIAVVSRIAGTSFTVTSSDATDTSVIAYSIIEP